ncbi:MAG: hypothetical protein PHX89_08560, partial [bacterium]|nr:hypothetical protein [bacterium]
LMDYLLWYNTEKPHRGLPDKQPPLRYLLASAGLELQQSNMLWTSTYSCFYTLPMLKSAC